MGMHGTGGMQNDLLMSGYADTCWKNIRAFFLRKVLTFFYKHSVELVNWERNLIFLIFHLLVNNQKKDEMGLVPDGQGRKDQSAAAFWSRIRPLDVSRSTISELDFPPSRYRLESKIRTLDLTLLSP